MSQAAESEDGRLWRSSQRLLWRRLQLRDDFRLNDVTGIACRLRQFENRRGQSDPALLEIDTTGGSVVAMLHLCNVLHNSPVPVVAKVVGNCHGAGFCVLQACTERLAISSAKIGLINNSLEVKFRLDADDDAEMVRQLAYEEIEGLRQSRERILDLLQNRLHKHSREELLEVMRSERILSADEALKLGFIDEIVSR